MTLPSPLPAYDEDEEVLIVAARSAWPLYTAISSYICQNRRTFRDVSRMGFYAERTIYPAFPLILERHNDVDLSETGLAQMLLNIDPVQQELGRVGRRALDYGWDEGLRTVLRLTDMGDERTLRRAEIRHEGGTSGGPWGIGTPGSGN
jgi:hypothetical protein